MTRMIKIIWMTGISGMRRMTSKTKMTGVTRMTKVTGMSGMTWMSGVTWITRIYLALLGCKSVKGLNPGVIKYIG